jgi:hypothetical protein
MAVVFSLCTAVTILLHTAPCLTIYNELLARTLLFTVTFSYGHYCALYTVLYTCMLMLVISVGAQYV